MPAPARPQPELSYRRGQENIVVLSGWVDKDGSGITNLTGTAYVDVYSVALSKGYVVTAAFMTYSNTPGTFAYTIPSALCPPGDDLYAIVRGYDVNGISQALKLISVTGGGTGWGLNTGMTFAGGGGNSAAGVPIVSNGAIVGGIVTNSGLLFSSAPTIGFTGTGNGATATCTVSPLGSNEVKLYIDVNLTDGG